MAGFIGFVLFCIHNFRKVFDAVLQFADGLFCFFSGGGSGRVFCSSSVMEPTSLYACAAIFKFSTAVRLCSPGLFWNVSSEVSINRLSA